MTNQLTQVYKEREELFDKEWVTRFDKDGVAIDVANEDELDELKSYNRTTTLALVDELIKWADDKKDIVVVNGVRVTKEIISLKSFLTLLDDFKSSIKN